MAKLPKINVNITINGAADAEKIKEAVVEELNRVVGASNGYRKVTGRKTEVGDYVKYSNSPRDYLTAGKYYEIIEIDDSDDPQILDDDGEEYDTWGDTFEVYEKVSEQPLKVGDYAKTLALSRHGSINQDAIVEIVGYGEVSTDHFNCRCAITGHTGLYKPEQLVKATEEEVKQAQDVAKWAKLGRKPNEYKEGDLVKITEYQHGANLGSIVEVTKVKVKGVDYGTIGYGADFGCIELVATVESRVDRR